MLYDEQLGVTQAWLSGRISGGKIEFRLLEAHGLAQFLPRDGRVVLNLKEDGTAEGEWQTDIGKAVHSEFSEQSLVGLAGIGTFFPRRLLLSFKSGWRRFTDFL